MQYQKESGVICLGDTKQAALYFGKILPLSFFFTELYRHPKIENYLRRGLNKFDKEPSEQDKKALMSGLKNIISDADSSRNSLFNFLSIFDELIGQNQPDTMTKFLLAVIEMLAIDVNLISLRWKLNSDKEKPNGFPKSVVKQINYLHQNLEYSLNGFHNILKSINDLLSISYVEDIQIVDSSSRTIRSDIDIISKKWAGSCGQVLLPSFCITSNEATESDLSLSLANINLIDTSKATWEQIIEYRKDEEARKKLRNLRLFLNTNYQGKSGAFIEDDLGKRLDAYYNTCKDWGFETLTSTITVVMDSENLISLLAGTTCATLFGGPVAVLTAGASIEIGKISLNLIKRKHAFNKLKRDHDLAYIIEAKDRLENTSFH
ncbi:MAG: hypothetical protein ABIN18_23150 [Pseudomonadota bacterium]